MLNFLIIIVAKYFYLISIFIVGVFFLKVKTLRKKQFATLAIPSLILTYLVAKLSGLFIKDPRPFVVEHIKPLIAHTADNGFPSDHTLLTMAIASIVFAYNKKLGIVLFVIGVLIGTARVLTNIHHPLDIIGATIIAIGVTAIVFFIEKNSIRNYGKINKRV